MRRFLFLILAVPALGVPALTALAATAPVGPPVAAGADVAPRKAPTCFGKRATKRAIGAKVVQGTIGDDVIVGDERDNVIFASQGNDRVFGGGNDLISKEEAVGTLLASGGAGNDDLRAGFGDATLNGGDGNDRFDVNSTDQNRAFLLLGGPGTDQFETSGVGNAVCVQSPNAPPVRC
jgi:Ca2+-binding RTX toxin-like protein